MTIVWQVDPEKMLNDLTDAYINAIRAEVYIIAKTREKEITQWMKDNHVWENITGVAEASLLTETYQIATDAVEIFLEHGAYYGVFLETMAAGKWGILAPAIDVWGPIIWQDVLKLMR